MNLNNFVSEQGKTCLSEKNERWLNFKNGSLRFKETKRGINLKFIQNFQVKIKKNRNLFFSASEKIMENSLILLILFILKIN